MRPTLVLLLATALGAHQAPSAPRSDLPVRLVGTAVFSADPSRSAAVVVCDQPGAPPRTATVLPGERACDLVEIVEVRRDAVVVTNLVTSRSETLVFDDRDTVPDAAVPAPGAGRRPRAPVPVSPVGGPITVNLSRETVEKYLSNLPDVLGSALATPHYRVTGDGQRVMEGLGISEVKNDGAIAHLGLRDGDVILDVNGEKLDSLPAALRFAGQVRNLSKAKMTVLRNGERLVLVVNVK